MIPQRWWPVALASEVLAGRPYAAVVQGLEIVLFRDGSGDVAALTDRCAHRRAPLSLGKVTEAGLIECPYHGWRYDGTTGACRSIPNLSAGELIPKTYRVRAFPVREEAGFILVDCLEGEGAGDTTPPIPMPIGDVRWEKSQLLAFPYRGFFELLVDAPSRVIDIAGVTLLDDHRFGDPVIDDNSIVQSFAARWHTNNRSKRAISDFPLAVDIVASRAGRFATIELRTMLGEPLSAITLCASPTTIYLTRMLWRGGPVCGPRSLPIRGRATLDTAQVSRVVPSASAHLFAENPPTEGREAAASAVTEELHYA